jgi:hypothetical protein
VILNYANRQKSQSKNAMHALDNLSIEDKKKKYFITVFKTDSIEFPILCCDTERKIAFPEKL